jgi:hypothetical protein
MSDQTEEEFNQQRQAEIARAQEAVAALSSQLALQRQEFSVVRGDRQQALDAARALYEAESGILLGECSGCGPVTVAGQEQILERQTDSHFPCAHHPGPIQIGEDQHYWSDFSQWGGIRRLTTYSCCGQTMTYETGKQWSSESPEPPPCVKRPQHRWIGAARQAERTIRSSEVSALAAALAAEEARWQTAMQATEHQLQEGQRTLEYLCTAAPSFSQRELLPFHVKTLTGKTITVWINQATTVDEVKQMIQDQTGYPPEMQRLIVQGRPIEGCPPIVTFFPRGTETCHLVLRLREADDKPTTADQ